MNEHVIYASHNFIVNGDFANQLDGWIISDEQKVTRQEGVWEGKTIGFMSAVNTGTGEQTIALAPLPRPTAGRAVYELRFFYEAVQGAEGTLKINPSLGGEVELRLVPSREADAEQTLKPDQLLLDLNLVEYPYTLALAPDETSVKFTIISPDNGGPGRPGAVRATFVSVELWLEPLRLDSVIIDGEPQSPEEKLHLCFGASHALALQLASDSLWSGTNAGLLVNDGVVDPERILSANPSFGQEHSVDVPWEIFCADIFEDKEIERSLAIRSEYTAQTYPLNAVCGHFQLDVIPLQEADWYPVIDLDESVELRVRVVSHYTQTPLANREVTWTLKGPTPADDVVLLRQFSDENGEAGLTWIPDTAGDWLIDASVDSHYKKEDARYAFAVRALKEDPWLSAKFALDGSPREWAWGHETGYPCRGATHEVTLAFAEGHALAETELALHWDRNDTPGDLGMTFTPDLDDLNPVEGRGHKWEVVCGNQGDSLFGLSVSCSKLLRHSPLQELVLAHNWLVIGEVKPPSRFPSVGGADLRLEVQILSQVFGMGGVSGIEVQWRVGSGPEETLLTGDDGWCVYLFSPSEEGNFTVTARVASPHDEQYHEHVFEITVLAEDPWSRLVTVTLNGLREERVGLLCFRNTAPVDLLIMPGDDTLLDEDIYLALTNEENLDLKFHIEPSPSTPRKLTRSGLTWKVSSTSAISASFQLHVCHDELAPYELQGRLLSPTLEGEGELEFDEKPIEGIITHPCLGGTHTLKFNPRFGSLLIGLDIVAKWVDESNRDLNVKLVPDHAVALPSGGLEWMLDARDSAEGGTLALALELSQPGYTFPALPMVLAHNRMEITDLRGLTFDPIVGQTFFLEVKSQSYYTQRSVPGLEVSFAHEGTSTLIPTSENGWARCAITATRPGDQPVRAELTSPYDGPVGPSFTFDVKVLAAAEASDSSTVSPSTPLTHEGGEVSDEQKSVLSGLEIEKVRESSCDPVVGESVRLGLKVVSSGTRRAASGVEVTFVAEQKTIQVMTDAQGWAYFSYRPENSGEVSVVATVEHVENSAEAPPSHTFRIKSLAADPWADALIQLGTDGANSVWGQATLFPRTPQVHVIRLSVGNASSHLLNRDISLGLKGYSSARDVGLTVVPALGVPRQLTSAGLEWQCTGTIGGAYNVVLEASRLLNQSPLNLNSLGPVPPAGLAES
ncbi:hypothetical protein KKQ10_25930 [Pseudomonas sp. MG-9]|uniref:Big-1 domain-containing protein n=1 Tax=Pseudomonas serboccidentalis TaxID=2964670 RepID=A0ABY7Z2K1_9PSED|nr:MULTISPECIES: hypothetical protein [Pseudomonas]MBT9268324.1 hypothetical protein [Pseudomonas sp. MG-9]WDR33868.1 hypothetical protein NN484_15225 [Pseudomonas serboccidentalis]